MFFLQRFGPDFIHIMAAASQDLVQCHAELKSSRKRPVRDTLAFSDVFTKEVLSKRIRKRNSDDKYELTTNKGHHHLVVVSTTKVKELCFSESQLLFDPRGELPHHWPFLRHIVTIATQMTCPSLETTVLSQRKALLLLNNNNVFSSTTTTTTLTKFFVDLPLDAVTPFIAGLRPARATTPAARRDGGSTHDDVAEQRISRTRKTTTLGAQRPRFHHHVVVGAFGYRICTQSA